MKFSSDNNKKSKTKQERSTNRSIHMRTAFAYEVNQLLNLPLRSVISLAGTERDRMRNEERGRLRATVLSILCVTINSHESI